MNLVGQCSFSTNQCQQYINIYQSFIIKTSQKTQTSLHAEFLFNVEKNAFNASAPLWNLETVTKRWFCVPCFSKRIPSASKDCALYFLCSLATVFYVSGRHPGDCRMISFWGYHQLWKKTFVFFKLLGMRHTFQLWKSIVCIVIKAIAHHYWHSHDVIQLFWTHCLVPPSTFHTKSTYPLRYPGMSQERDFLYNPIVGSGGLLPWILLDRTYTPRNLKTNMMLHLKMDRSWEI